MITWLKMRPGMTLREFLGCLGDCVKRCDVHFSERASPTVPLTPPYPGPRAAPYLDIPCSGFSFGYDEPGTSDVMTAYVLLAPRSAAPALDVPID